jgi:type II secretory pathway component PulM
MAQTDQESKSRAQLEALLGSPMRLRAVMTLVLVGAWYFAVYQPAVGHIEQKQQTLAMERKRLQLAETIEHLRSENKRFRDRFPKQRDQNAAIQDLLEGIRPFPLKLTNLDPKPPKDVGPFKSMLLDVGVEGDYLTLEKLLRWLETNPRLYRVDQIRIDPARVGNGGRLNYRMQLVLMGVLG